MDATFQGKIFPNITGISRSDTPVYSGGKYDHDITTITIEGVAKNPTANQVAPTTAFGFANLEIKDIVDGFGDLVIGTKTYAKCLISQISMTDSEHEYLVPYSANFTQKTQDVENIVNQWSFSENNKIITATHTVSATGVDTGNGIKPMDKAKTFVDAVAVVPQNVYFTLAATKNKISTNEVFDTSGGSYSLTTVYNIYDSTSFFVADAHVINCSLKINYDRKSESLNVSVDGSIQQALDATGAVDLTPFNSDRAKLIADDFVANSVNSSSEGYSLETLVNNTYNFTVNEDARKVDFSYNFKQVEDKNLIGAGKNVLHEYSKSFSVSKDEPYINATINGTLTYALSDNPIDINTELKNSARWLAVNAAFGTIDQRAELITDFNDFRTANLTEYKLDGARDLQLLPTTYNIDKDLKNITITYSYNYNNKYDYGLGVLKNLNLSITDTQPILRKNVKESIAGWSKQETGTKVGVLSGVASADNDIADIDLLKTAMNLKVGKGVLIRDSSLSSARKKISYSVAKYYDKATTAPPTPPEQPPAATRAATRAIILKL